MNACLKCGRRMYAMMAGHLAVEKMFKAVLTAKDEEILKIHNLIRLA
jgi:HEPN domain-containing protein